MAQDDRGSSRVAHRGLQLRARWLSPGLAALARERRIIVQHAVSVYLKSGQTDRAELAAFFLEGVMLPGETSDSLRTAGSP